MKNMIKNTVTALVLSSSILFTGCASNQESMKTTEDKSVETASRSTNLNTNKETTDDNTKNESTSIDKNTETSSSTDKKILTTDNKTSDSSSNKKETSTTSTTTSSSTTHTHTWVDDRVRMQVQTGTKTVYEDVYHEGDEHQEFVDDGSCNICNVCGKKMYTDQDLSDHFTDHDSKGEPFGYHYELIGHYVWVTDTPGYTEKVEKQVPVYEMQDVVVSRHCTTCGAKE